MCLNGTSDLDISDTTVRCGPLKEHLPGARSVISSRETLSNLPVFGRWFLLIFPLDGISVVLQDITVTICVTQSPYGMRVLLIIQMFDIHFSSAIMHKVLCNILTWQDEVLHLYTIRLGICGHGNLPEAVPVEVFDASIADSLNE